MAFVRFPVLLRSQLRRIRLMSWAVGVLMGFS